MKYLLRYASFLLSILTGLSGGCLAINAHAGFAEFIQQDSEELKNKIGLLLSSEYTTGAELNQISQVSDLLDDIDKDCITDEVDGGKNHHHGGSKNKKHKHKSGKDGRINTQAQTPVTSHVKTVATPQVQTTAIPIPPPPPEIRNPFLKGKITQALKSAAVDPSLKQLDTIEKKGTSENKAIFQRPAPAPTKSACLDIAELSSALVKRAKQLEHIEKESTKATVTIPTSHTFISGPGEKAASTPPGARPLTLGDELKVATAKRRQDMAKKQAQNTGSASTASDKHDSTTENPACHSQPSRVAQYPKIPPKPFRPVPKERKSLKTSQSIADSKKTVSENSGQIWAGRKLSLLTLAQQIQDGTVEIENVSTEKIFKDLTVLQLALIEKIYQRIP